MMVLLQKLFIGRATHFFVFFFICCCCHLSISFALSVNRFSFKNCAFVFYQYFFFVSFLIPAMHTQHTKKNHCHSFQQMESETISMRVQFLCIVIFSLENRKNIYTKKRTKKNIQR